MIPFKYTRNGVTRTVIDIKPFTTWQYWKTFGLLWMWTSQVLYIIILSALCPVTIFGLALSCPYLTTATVVPVLMVTLFTFLWTFFTRKKELRKNHIYGD